MTGRDLGAMLDRASEHLAEVDFADGAWSAALAERRNRRRRLVAGAGVVAAAALAVTAVQLGGAPTPKPAPVVSTTTQVDRGALSDGTTYAMMPLEGKEGTLRHFDSGLPSVIDLRAHVTGRSDWTTPPQSVVAVYLQPAGELFHPVLVTGDGKQVLADKVSLARTYDADGNAAAPLSPRAFGGGRYVVFPQPGKVVRLDVGTGDTVAYPVPSQSLEQAGWAADNGTIVARSADHVWTIDPWQPGARARRADGALAGRFRLDADQQAPGGTLLVTRQDGQGAPGTGGRVAAPVAQVWGETINTEERAATGAFFDQEVTSKVIRRGNGPIYQGLVAVDAPAGSARVLLAPENPDGQTGRFNGCCTVLGWADGDTVLFQSVGSHGAWVLAWNVVTGEVFETTRITADPAREQIPTLALNVGWRY